jgi:CDP-diacylglycerol--serine O-phosphatidyltransferase
MNLDHKEDEHNLRDQDHLEKMPQRGIYLLPNLLTTAALFAGFYSIVAAMKTHFEIAAIAIFVAMIADGLDGRVARLTNTQSAFGAQYDSISDMVAFGIAPALVIYSWSLSHLGKLGWLAAFVYAAATALRLARFNTQVGDAQDKQYFQGLPCPSAAGIMASIVWMGSVYDLEGLTIAVPLSLATIAVATLMVSTIRYSSFKSVDFKGKVPFVTIVLAVFIIAAIALEPPEMLFALFFLYVLSGPFNTLWQLRKVRKLRTQDQSKSLKK